VESKDKGVTPYQLLTKVLPESTTKRQCARMTMIEIHTTIIREILLLENNFIVFRKMMMELLNKVSKIKRWIKTKNWRKE